MFDTLGPKTKTALNLATLLTGLAFSGCTKNEEATPAPVSGSVPGRASFPPITLLSQAHWGGPRMRKEDFESVVVPSQNSILQWMRKQPDHVYFVEGLFGDLAVRRQDLHFYPNKRAQLQAHFPDPAKVNLDALSTAEQRSVAQVGAPWAALYLGVVKELYPTLSAHQRDILELKRSQITALTERLNVSAGSIERAPILVEFNNTHTDFLRSNELYAIDHISQYSAAMRVRTGQAPTNIALIFGALHDETISSYGIPLQSAGGLPKVKKITQ